MSGKEVLLSEKPTTENPAGSYRARTGLVKLKQDGKSGLLVRRNDAIFDKAVMKVRNEACMKDEDPDEAEAVFTQDVLGSKPGGKKGGGIDTFSKRLDVHHHKPKSETPQSKRISDYVKRKQDQLRLADSRIADLLSQERTDEITAQIKKIRKETDNLYDEIQRGND